MFEECETVEELNEQSYQAGFVCGLLITTGALILAAT